MLLAVVACIILYFRYKSDYNHAVMEPEWSIQMHQAVELSNRQCVTRRFITDDLFSHNLFLWYKVQVYCH